MITLQPLMGISVMPVPPSEASGVECFKLISINPEIAEVARRQEIEREVRQSMDKEPSVNKERTLSRGLPTPSLSPKMPRI